MALHRDIYWVGKQWAVTGHGMQAIDKKLQGKFDIEASRLWERGLTESLRAEKWFNINDFSKGLVLARARYPLPPGQAAPLEESVAPLKDSAPVEPPKPAAEKLQTPETVARSKDSGPVAPPKPVVQKFQMPESVAGVQDSVPVEAPKPVVQKFQMRFEAWPAKFVRPWRVAMRPNGIVAGKDN
jgi:hypothetical protein